MIVIPATPIQYLEMFLIVLGIVLFSQVFNVFFGLKPSQQMANQERIRQIQQEILDSQNDPEEIQRLQLESMNLMKQTLRKTLIPSCIRCAIFSGIWAVLGFLYPGVDFLGSGIFGIYLIYSLGLSLVIFYIKKLWKKFRSDEQTEEPFMDVAKALRGPRIATTQNYSLDTQRQKDLTDLKRNLELKKQRGEIPSDLDIDAEIERIARDNIEIVVKPNENSTEDEKSEPLSSWKRKLSQDSDSGDHSET